MATVHEVTRARPSSQLLLLATLVLAPFDAVLAVPGGLPGPIASVPRLLFMLFWLLEGVAVVAAVHRGAAPRAGALIPWLVWSLIATAFGIRADGELRYLTLCTVGVGYCAMAVMASKEGLDKALLSAWVAIALVTGVVELFWGWRLPASRQHAFSAEITGPFYNPLFFAVFLVWLMIGMMSRLVVDVHRRHWLTAALLAALFVLLVRSGSRTGVLAAGVGVTAVIAVGLWWPGTRDRTLVALRSHFLTALIIGAAGVALIGLPELIRAKLTSLTELTVDSPSAVDALTSRAYAASIGLQYAVERPLLGHGAAATEEVLGRDPLLVAMGNVNVHNWFIEILINSGIVGALLFAAPLLGAALTCARRFSKPVTSELGARELWPSAAIMAFPILSSGPSSMVGFAPMWIMSGLLVGAAHTRGLVVEVTES